MIQKKKGSWGVENNEWCGINDSCKGSTAASECWSLPGIYKNIFL